MKLIVPILINCVLVLCVYSAEKYTPVKKWPYIVRQIVIGVLFGCVSAFASSYGVSWLDSTVNVRDAAPLSAGLIFGAPAGIISGFIGVFALCMIMETMLPIIPENPVVYVGMSEHTLLYRFFVNLNPVISLLLG